MPILKAGFKSLRQSIRHRKRNLVCRDEIKESVKNFQKFLLDKKNKEAEEALRKCTSVLDKAVQHKIIKKNTAARKKSRLVAALRKIKK